MHTKKFLAAALGPDGFYCMFAACKIKNKREQRFYSDLDIMVDAASNLDNAGYDVYFALASFKEKGSRKVTNASNLSSFFLDLDCGDGKEYATKEEAVIALRDFCKSLALPKPTLVDSGRGVHVYWFLGTPIPVAEWVAVAERLKTMCATKGFMADPVVTADVARVLRVPFTHNYKTDPPTEVRYIGGASYGHVDFDTFSRRLGGEIIPAPSLVSKPQPDQYSHLESVFKDILRKSLHGRGCEQIRLAVTDKQSVSEPVWRGVLSILKSCTDGNLDRAHLISKGYEGYSEAETAVKWSNLDSAMPYSCVRFDEYNPDVCGKCPHWMKVGSPRTLGNRVKEATDNVVEAPAISLTSSPVITYTIPTYPKPYFRGANGGVYIHSVDKDGEPFDQMIYHNDLYVVKRVRDVEIGESVVMRLHLPKDGVREFTLPLTAVTSKEEFRRQMSMQGVALMRMEDLMQYTTTWVNYLQESGGATMAHKQFGWVGENCESFVLGNQEVYADRLEFNPPSTQTVGLLPSFETRGSLEKWKETINFYNREGFELHQFVVGLGFGSVLMKFMGEISCSAVHLHSKESGVGKTTAMLAALSIWGKPDELMLQERDTYNSKMNRGEVMHNLPLCMDELTNTHGKQLSDIAYQFTSGKQRMRMSGGSNVERFRGEPWNLIAITTGNTSMVELISLFKAMPKAEAQRILEIPVPRMFNSFEDKADTDGFARALEANCGWAGVPYLQHIMKNIDGVRELVAQVQARVDNTAALTSENRFWSAGITVGIAGLIIAKQAGLLSIPIEPVFKWAMAQLKANKLKVADMGSSAEQTLNDYMHEHWNNVLWIKSTDDSRSKGNEHTIVIPDAVPKGQLVARYETDVKKAYLLPKPLKQWCGKQQIEFGSFVDELITTMNGKRTKVRLGKGTQVVLPSTHVIVVDCNINVENT